MKQQTILEERWNALTHGAGLLLSLLGLILLLWFYTYDTFQGVLAILLYGISLCVLYFASTMYHYVNSDKLKIRFRRLDHISIYFLIAGTYSPIVLIGLKDSLGWELFWIVWGIAGFGTILKIFFTGRFETMSVILYLIMGWLIVFDFEALNAQVDHWGLTLLIGGGLAYTLGIIFYALNKIPFNHVIWHIFVLTGSILHYLFIFFYII
ncbi:MAG: hemolysin III family protein [Flavobacteriaceae bacterium]|nr:hemolysin III family protein [Flavobacteriaceae bacterium]